MKQCNLGQMQNVSLISKEYVIVHFANILVLDLLNGYKSFQYILTKFFIHMNQSIFSDIYDYSIFQVNSVFHLKKAILVLMRCIFVGDFIFLTYWNC